MSEPKPVYTNGTYPDAKLIAPSGREADMQLRRHLIGAIRAIESKWGMEQSIPERVR